jgi:ABC-type maltose transport system permease subunit
LSRFNIKGKQTIILGILSTQMFPQVLLIIPMYLIVSIISQSQRTATATLVIQRLSSALLIRWGQVAAAAVLTIVPTIILFSFVQKRLVKGLTAGAIKE